MVLPAGIKEIGDWMFMDCERLTSVTLNGSVTEIGQGAFYNCKRLENFQMPTSVTKIKDEAFRNCESLTSISIPAKVTEVGSSAFAGCKGLTGVYITDLKAWCKITFSGFSGDCNPLYCGKNLYLNNVLVTDLTIPSGVYKIGNYGFAGCTSLESVTIPTNLTIGSYAFEDCENISSITFTSNAPGISNNSFKNVVATAYYPEGNTTWTEAKKAQYGGTLTWVPYAVVEGTALEAEVPAPEDVAEEIAEEIPACAVVSAEGLTLKPDGVHFDAPSLRVFGRRYFEAYKKLL
jgi:hypothetical protein